jgi:hypothetical protein
VGILDVMVVLPKSPTSRSPPNWPKLAGAMIKPLGEFKVSLGDMALQKN